jgi:hypothetical protein
VHNISLANHRIDSSFWCTEVHGRKCYSTELYSLQLKIHFSCMIPEICSHFIVQWNDRILLNICHKNQGILIKCMHVRMCVCVCPHVCVHAHSLVFTNIYPREPDTRRFTVSFSDSPWVHQNLLVLRSFFGGDKNAIILQVTITTTNLIYMNWHTLDTSSTKELCNSLFQTISCIITLSTMLWKLSHGNQLQKLVHCSLQGASKYDIYTVKFSSTSAPNKWACVCIYYHKNHVLQHHSAT